MYWFEWIDLMKLSSVVVASLRSRGQPEMVVKL